MDKMKRSRQYFVKHLFQGLCMGFAEAIPGVNGATVALLFGIYIRIIDALKCLTPTNISKLIKSTVFFWRVSDRQQFYVYAHKMQLAFLVPIGLGTLISIWVLSGFIPMISGNYPGPFNAFVFGVVAISAYIPLSYLKGIHLKHAVIIIFCAAATFILVGLPVSDGSHDWLFLYGVMGACALLLPGISGSYLLKVFGQYEYLLVNLHKAFLFEISSMVIVGIFILGMVTGIILFAKILSWLLHYHQSTVMAILAGIMIGALRTLWPSEISDGVAKALPLIGLMLLGGLGMAFLISQEQRIKSLKTEEEVSRD